MTSLFGTSFFLAIFSGALLWLSFPGGGDLTPLLLFALVPLYFAFSKGSKKKAATAGLLAGLVHFMSLLYWIIFVLGTYGKLAWFISVPALFLLSLYMSGYFMVFAILGQAILRVFSPLATLWLLPLLWVGLDWLRCHLFSGFPWMDLGYALYKTPAIIQFADLFAHYGITYVIVFINTFLFLLSQPRAKISKKSPLLISAVLLIGSLATYNHYRYQEIEQQLASSTTPHIKIGLVQGNIDQSVKWSPSHQTATIDTYLNLTHSLIDNDKPTLVIWPETALPFYPVADPHLIPIQKMVAKAGIGLITGAPWYEVFDRKDQKILFYNSALLLQPDGEFHGKYYKSHLVPFGEYVPLKEFLPFIAPLVKTVGDFRVGTVEKPLTWNRANAGILICYESVFPDISRKWVETGANLLINLTNDAWYGKSSAPYHSLAMAVLRAVETRRILVRPANTGISAFIAPTGKILQQSEIFVPWAAAQSVPLLTTPTFWVQYGFVFAPACLVFGLLFGMVALRKQKLQQHQLSLPQGHKFRLSR